MSGALQPSSSHEMSAADGAITAHASFTDGYINRVVIKETWPGNMTTAEVEDAMRDEYKAHGEAGGINPDWFSFVSPQGPHEKNAQIAAERFGGMTEALGFSLDTDQVSEDGQTIKTRVYTYPSIARANDFMGKVFGDGQVEFVPYDGSEYTTEEFMNAFVEKKVLIAAQQPHALHDLSDHLIGWIGLDPKLIDSLADRLGQYLVRAQAERELLPKPPIYRGAYYGDSCEARAEHLFNPSLTVLNAAMTNMDLLSANIAVQALAAETKETSEYLRAPARIAYEIQTVFDLNLRRPDRAPELPNGLLGDSHKYLYYGQNTYERFVKADEVGNELVRAA